MISFFNKLGNSWAAKIICAALALSMMAFWGLGGLSDGFSADNKAISVDSTIITVNHLNQEYKAGNAPEQNFFPGDVNGASEKHVTTASLICAGGEQGQFPIFTDFFKKDPPLQAGP